MACYSPISGFKSLTGGISFSPKTGYIDLPMQVPCGNCIGCRLEYSRQWAVRATHEAQLHECNSFITLTYDEVHLPEDGSLSKEHLALFLKRLRKSISPERISYLGCGEYGDELARPHYHLILFGYDFSSDRRRQAASSDDVPTFTSAHLERLWPFGLHQIGTYSPAAARYIANYVVKKKKGPAALAYYGTKQPEFISVSRNPALGLNFVRGLGRETYKKDNVCIDGVLQKPPRYYDKYFKKQEAMTLVKRNRIKKANTKQNRLNSTPERLEVRKKVKELTFNTFSRNLK
ncbi:MAG: replication initiator protein [Microvirus sp.]|nr:MAG: replication initiator protein [Microvirus sp.]